MYIHVDKHPRYNPNVVVRETGIKADTLRAWERRYGLPRPDRTAGGHRLYSQYDIETVKWLQNQRKEKGMSISKAVALWRSIEDNGQDPINISETNITADIPSDIYSLEINALNMTRMEWINACLKYDECSTEQILNHSFALYPVEIVCTEILQKGLAAIGDLWYRGEVSVQQEHFASELVNRRLHALIVAAPQPILKPKILMTCPPKEHHVFPTLLLNALLRYRGWDVINLGANVPIDQINTALDQVKPDLVVSTAMRLRSAASLKDVAVMLEAENTPLAFGGGIFIQSPELSARIPGYYLAESIIGAINNIESILTELVLEYGRNPLSDEYMQVIDSFGEAKPSIDAQIMKWANSGFNQEEILVNLELANDQLGNDILAALALGDVDYVRTNLIWLRGLLSHRDIPEDLLIIYLKTYQETAEEFLQYRSDLIVHLLADFVREINADGV